MGMGPARGTSAHGPDAALEAESGVTPAATLAAEVFDSDPHKQRAARPAPIAGRRSRALIRRRNSWHYVGFDGALSKSRRRQRKHPQHLQLHSLKISP